MHATLVASLAAAAAAAPLVARQAAPPPEGINDAVILNYALSLEHLEATFYREALKKFGAEDFKKVGLGADFYNNLEEIAFDEKTHVDFLVAGLTAAGATPVAECTYDFGYTDVQGFLATANILEGVGVSAYLGAAKYIASPDYLTAAGAILTVEARHSAYLRDNQDPAKSPFPAPFDIPLEFNEVFTLAAPFIKSCPDQGPDAGTLKLGLTGFPAITAAPAGVAKPGDKITLTVAKDVPATNAVFITFPGGPIQAQLSGSGSSYEIIVPEQAQPGQAYVVLTKNGDKPTDDNIVAGPAVLDIADNAAKFQKENPDYSYGKDCEEKPEHPYKPEQPKAPEYPKAPEHPKQPEQPKTPSYPEKQPEHPKQPEAPKQPEHPYKPEEPKKPSYPTPTPSPKPSYPAEKPTYSTPAEKPTYTKPAEKQPVPTYPAQPEHQPKDEDCDEYGNPKKDY